MKIKHEGISIINDDDNKLFISVDPDNDGILLFTMSANDFWIETEDIKEFCAALIGFVKGLD